MIKIVRGTDPKLAITLQQKDDCGEVEPMPITNTMVVSFIYKDLIGKKTKTSTSGVEITEPVYGKLSVSFTDIETEKMRLGTLDFDVQVEEGETKLIWNFVGKITVQGQI